ncbi:MAG: ComEA family DNA-binding protein [bacterium]
MNTIGRFSNISRKLGFTDTEFKVVIFILCMFCIGLAAYYIKYQGSVSPVIEYDYSTQDSIFFNSGIADTEEKDIAELEKKKVDSNSELLNFSVSKNISGTNKGNVRAKKININSAGIKELASLPGIGEKTAAKIIEYRNVHGRFKSLKEIMNVKGIGEGKFAELKDFIIVE